jgi:hypothetical protein
MAAAMMNTRGFGQLQDLSVPGAFDDPQPDAEITAGEDN